MPCFGDWRVEFTSEPTSANNKPEPSVEGTREPSHDEPADEEPSPKPRPRDPNSARTMAIDYSAVVSASALPFQPPPPQRQVMGPPLSLPVYGCSNADYGAEDLASASPVSPLPIGPQPNSTLGYSGRPADAERLAEVPSPPSIGGPLPTARPGATLAAESPNREFPKMVAASTINGLPVEPGGGPYQIVRDGPPPLPLETFPIDRCARIAASIARGQAEKTAILERNDLAPASWEALDRHWAEIISEQSRRGKANLMRLYDEAYVAQLEAERGAISVKEYAQLLVAAERGTVDSALRELTIPVVAWMRIRRRWIARTIEDGELGAKVRNALEAERDL